MLNAALLIVQAGLLDDYNARVRLWRSTPQLNFVGVPSCSQSTVDCWRFLDSEGMLGLYNEECQGQARKRDNLEGSHCPRTVGRIIPRAATFFTGKNERHDATRVRGKSSSASSCPGVAVARAGTQGRRRGRRRRGGEARPRPGRAPG